jgi:hypothetical protein
MEVKLGCHFVSILVGSLQIDYHLVIGLIIMPLIQEHLMSLNLLLG